jgi:hypothetical protein
MQRIGYFSTRGYWHAPLAVFVVIVVGGVALPLGQSLGIGLLGFGVACSLIIGFVLSIQATLNQNIVEMMHEVDSSLQLVDYSFNFLGNSRLKMNSARGAVADRYSNQEFGSLGEIPGAQRVGSSHWPRPRVHRRSKGNDEECRLRSCRGAGG